MAIALLFAASLTGVPAAAGGCDHPSATGESHHDQTPADQQPCSHDQPGHPAAPCAVLPTCAGPLVVIPAPVVTIPPAAIVRLAAAPAAPPGSFAPALDVPPPRL